MRVKGIVRVVGLVLEMPLWSYVSKAYKMGIERVKVVVVGFLSTSFSIGRVARARLALSLLRTWLEKACKRETSRSLTFAIEPLPPLRHEHPHPPTPTHPDTIISSTTPPYTMADYSKKKNDELAALCKERGLAHTGKKADLVKRLEEHDAQGSKASAAEDEIDWDDEPGTETAKEATTEAAANAVAAGGIGEVANPLAVPNQVPAIDPSQTNDLTVVPPAPEGTEAAAEAAAVKEASPEKDYSTGLAERTLDEEIEKRKARARKFGMPEDSEEIKALERAKRFGNADVLGALNKTLPVGERKRGREGGHDGGVRKSSRGRPGAGRRQESGRREKASPAPGSGVQKGTSWMSEADRAAAEKRKARFAKVDA